MRQRVSGGRNAFVELERQLEVRTRELTDARTQLTEARENLAEVLEQQTAASEVLNVIRTYLKIADCCRSDINVE